VRSKIRTYAISWTISQMPTREKSSYFSDNSQHFSKKPQRESQPSRRKKRLSIELMIPIEGNEFNYKEGCVVFPPPVRTSSTMRLLVWHHRPPVHHPTQPLLLRFPAR